MDVSARCWQEVWKQSLIRLASAAGFASAVENQARDLATTPPATAFFEHERAGNNLSLSVLLARPPLEVAPINFARANLGHHLQSPVVWQLSFGD